MNDEFLYRLRTEPPTTFAHRLKARLDRETSRSRHTVRVSLLLFLIGSAFALVSPTVRQIIVSYVDAPKSNDAMPGDAPATGFVAGSAANIRTAESLQPRPHLNGIQATPLRPGTVDNATQPTDPASGGPAPGARLDEGSRPLAPMTVPIAAQNGTAEQAALQGVATRRGLFKVMRFMMAPLEAMLHNTTPFDARLAQKNAQNTARLSALIGPVFNIDTRAFPAPTEALPKIWTHLADFDSKAQDLTAAAFAAAAVAGSGDKAATLEAMARVGKTCEACHDEYREPTRN